MLESSSQVNVPASTGAQLMAVSTTDSRTYLPSTANNKSNLRNVEEVLKENEKLIKQGKHGTLCQILARDCFFGKVNMEKCTPGGKYSFGLPRHELNQLKRVILNQFPKLTDCPEQFEPNWEACIKSIENACRHLHQPSKGTI